MMNRRHAMLSLLSITTGLVAGVGIAEAQPGPGPNRYPPPPPLRREVMPGPRRGHYWQPGHWRWAGGRYVWIDGTWVAGRARRGQWVQGQWQWSPRRREWIWRPAHWE